MGTLWFKNAAGESANNLQGKSLNLRDKNGSKSLEWMDREWRVNRWIDRRMNGWTNGWMDGRIVKRWADEWRAKTFVIFSWIALEKKRQQLDWHEIIT